MLEVDRDVIKFQSNNWNEEKNFATLMRCSGVDYPALGLTPQSVASCVDAAQTAVRKGWAKNLAIGNLALMQLPEVGPRRENNALGLTQLITSEAAKAKADTGVLQICLRGENDCNKTPIKKEEMYYVWGHSQGKLTPEMNSSRAVMVPSRHAALNAMMEAAMMPESFRMKKGDGFLSVEETLAEIRRSSPKPENERAFRKCLAKPENIPQCVKEGARMGLGLVVDEGVTYKGTQFLGIKKNGELSK